MSSALKECLALFREKPFVLYAGGNLISVAGSGMQAIVTSWLVLQMTGTSLSIALLLIFSTFPGILFSPLIGIFVDRLDRKVLATSMDIFRAAVTVLILLLWEGHWLQAWHLYLAEALISLGDLAFLPAMMALLRELLSKEQLLSANATLGMLLQLGTAFGTAGEE
ncbi:MFS transporter [Ktedonospora formicarum]|uniref:MFS transporter n=1 Tax=Ktedonospora formicarum TaxID=2778364 RepID=A0A8J3I6E9_9CHLR|nr:MFS transporter [Ktedonospora formicarum]GHO50444.1 hypothetical protein KSX_86070 [Ktedonospora formicarum]